MSGRMSRVGRELFQRIEAVLGRREAGWILALVFAGVYAWGYFHHPLFPGHENASLERGWWTWSDQKRYLDEAAAIARWQLDPKTYFYPAGYPLLGALFWRWMPVNPFFVPDLLLALVAAAIWWRLAQRWVNRLVALVIAVVFLVAHRTLLGNTMLVPWNTLGSQAALLAGVWVVMEKSGRAAVGWLCGLAAATYWIRPVDMAPFAPVLAFALWKLETWTQRVGWALLSLLTIGAAVAGVGALNLAIFGHWRTPYEWASLHGIGFFSYPMSLKAFWLLIDGQLFFGETEPALLWRFPWLPIAIVGIVFWIRHEGARAVAASLAVALSWTVYFNYNDFLPSDIYRFTLIHYLTWSFPLLFLLAATACWRGWRDRGVRWAFAASVVMLALCIGLHLDEGAPLEPRSESPNVWRISEKRPLLIEFPGTPIEKASALRLDNRPLIEYSDFLLPYENATELRLVLGVRTPGTALTLANSETPKTAPTVREFRWRWRFDRQRLSRVLP
jgi:hypothetical protein